MQKTYPQSDLPIRDGKRDESKSRIYKNIAKCMKGIHNVIFLLGGEMNLYLGAVGISRNV